MDASEWTGVTRALAAAVPGTKAHFVGRDAGLPGGGLQAVSGYAADFVASYGHHYAHLNAHAPAWTRLAAGQAAYAAQMADEADLLRSEYYNDWLRPQGDLRGGALMILSHDAERMFLMGLHVEERARGASEPAAMRLLRRYAPMMRHALSVNRMTLGLRIDAAALRQGVEPVDVGLVLLGGAGGVLHASPRAEAMLDEGTPVSVDLLGRLRFADRAADDRLRAALRSGVGGATSAFRAGPGADLHEVRLLPLTPELATQIGLSPFLLMRAPALLVAIRPQRARRDDAGVVAQRLGLSRSEAEVALALAAGRTPAEVAEARRTSLHTVRNQVKAAAAKLGLRRQAELAVAAERALR